MDFSIDHSFLSNETGYLRLLKYLCKVLSYSFYSGVLDNIERRGFIPIIGLEVALCKGVTQGLLDSPNSLGSDLFLYIFFASLNHFSKSIFVVSLLFSITHVSSVWLSRGMRTLADSGLTNPCLQWGCKVNIDYGSSRGQGAVLYETGVLSFIFLCKTHF